MSLETEPAWRDAAQRWGHLTLVRMLGDNGPSWQRPGQVTRIGARGQRATTRPVPHQEQHGGVIGGKGVDLGTHLRSLWIIEVVETLDVQEERDAGRHTGVPQCRHVSLDDVGVHPFVADAVSCGLYGLGDDVYTGDGPTTLGEEDRPSTGTASEIEGRSVRRFSCPLLLGKEIAELMREGLRVGLPGCEPYSPEKAVPAAQCDF